MKKLVILLCFILVGCKSIPVTNQYEYEKIVEGEDLHWSGQSENEYYFQKNDKIFALDKKTLQERKIDLLLQEKEHASIFDYQGKQYLKISNRKDLKIFEGLSKDKLICETNLSVDNMKCDNLIKEYHSKSYPFNQTFNTISFQNKEKYFFEKIESAEIIGNYIYVLLNHFEDYNISIFDFDGNLKNKIENLPQIAHFYYIDDATLIATNSSMKDIFIIDINRKTVEKMDKIEGSVFTESGSKVVEVHKGNTLEVLRIKKKS